MSTNFDLNRTGILRNAYQMAGLVPDGQDPDNDQLAKGSDLLNLRVKALQSEGIILVTLTQQTFTLTAGTAKYALPASTLDVDIGKPFVTGNSINVPLEWWSRAMYMALTVPTTQGQPTSIYVEKTQTINFYLYPVPDSSWTSVTLPVISLLNDLDSGADVTGLQAKYLRTLVLGVASDLALSAGLLPRYQALSGEYEMEKKRATADDTERGNIRFIPDYGWQANQWGWGRK